MPILTNKRKSTKIDVQAINVTKTDNLVSVMDVDTKKAVNLIQPTYLQGSQRKWLINFSGQTGMTVKETKRFIQLLNEALVQAGQL